MAGGKSTRSNPSQARKRVDAVDSRAATGLVRAKDGSAFAKCEECNKNVPVALISMHSCSLEAKIKMNLEAQVVEKPAEVKKPVERKKPKSSEPKAKKAKVEKGKKGKDPNKPKRPPTAFFVFLEEFRKSFKEANPDSNDVKRVGKEAGEKWKSLSDEEKKPYMDRAAELKAEYEKALESYNAAEDGAEQEGSDREDAAEEGGQEESGKDDAAKENEELTDEE
ncbi:high mobility group B protein 7-like [Prosopis cineraria]|uniref:high mobility group B protein 7-like n=1 Tax=Prosopis cineraria TaxID=364024 RepID=UPI00240FF6AA|nr:high mobility group B protein 7-like [Prosopis cineraria]